MMKKQIRLLFKPTKFIDSAITTGVDIVVRIAMHPSLFMDTTIPLKACFTKASGNANKSNPIGSWVATISLTPADTTQLANIHRYIFLFSDAMKAASCIS